MTGLYWAAAALAMAAAAHTIIRLRRDRSLMVAMSVICMLALGTALLLTASTPALLRARLSHPVIAWTSGLLGLLAVWTLLAVLAAVIGDSDRPWTLMTIPVLGAVSAGLLEVALRHAGHAAPDARSPSGLPVVAAQLMLLTYYYPALGRIAALAWRCARRIPVRHIDAGMWAVASASIAGIALIALKSAAIIMTVSGAAVATAEITGIAVAQGVAAIVIVAGVTVSAWFPGLASMARQGQMWSAYWRLHRLWAALMTVTPEVHLPSQRGTRFNVSYRLHRRVIEIRDAELALRPYSSSGVAARAAEAAHEAGLPPEQRDAVVEAAVIATALDARQQGASAREDDTPAVTAGPAPRSDLDAETTRLILVSRAIRHSQIVRRFTRLGSRSMTGGQAGHRHA